MTSEIANYDFHGSAVRIHTGGETVEYCARDIAATLGYTNTSKAISDHCRGVTNRYPIVDSLGRTQEATFISEGDVYRLIVSSQLPAARVRALALRRGRPADPPHRRIHPGTSRRR